MKKFYLLLIFCPSIVHSATILKESPQIGFSKGLNVKDNSSSIDDEESPNMNNMVGTINGSCIKRNGSKRFNPQVISTNPVNSLMRVYASTPGVISKALIATSGGRIYVSTDDITLTVISSGLSTNQHYSFASMNGLAIMTGDNSTDTIKAYKIASSSLVNLMDFSGSTEAVKLYGKYLVNFQNILFLANCTELSLGATYYKSRVYYSLVLNPSSFTYSRYFDVQKDDGEEITAIWVQNNKLEISKPSSISELSFTILNPDPSIGNQTLSKIINGFGVLAPRTLVVDGVDSIFLATDGIRIFDAGKRANFADTSTILSKKIDPIIRDIIDNKTYGNCSAFYYKKKKWYVFSYEDSKKNPHGKANSILIFDTTNGEWYPMTNWNAECFTAFDGIGDKGELLYGDSFDGYIHYVDLELEKNDSRKEILIHSCDNQTEWNRASQDVFNFKEGTASIKVNTTASLTVSSMSFMRVLNFGEWPDNSKTNMNDKISFKAYVSSLQNVSSLRIDLEINDVENDFDSTFTSVTLASASFSGGESNWTTFEIPLSSFPILPEWISISTETFPFANSATYYGIRFVNTAIDVSTISIDDIRLVGNMDQPLNAYRFTKNFNFGSVADKQFRQVVTNTDFYPDSNFNIEIYEDFNSLADRRKILGGYGKNIYVAGYNGSEGIWKLSSIDFSVGDSTDVVFSSVAAYRSITDDENTIYALDRYYHRAIKIPKSDLTSITTAYGSIGSGINQLNTPWQIAIDKNGKCYITDALNHRIMVRKTSDFSFIASYGELGTGSTNYHLPTGIHVDDRFAYIGDDGNNRIIKVDKSTWAFISSVSVNINTYGSLFLVGDEKNIYSIYNVIHATSPNYVDVVLEKRDKNNLGIVQRVRVLPQNASSVAVSTYGVMGSPTLKGEFIFITFTDDQNGNGNYYIQKRLISDLSIMKEFKSTKPSYAIAGEGLSFIPKRKNLYTSLGVSGSYLQINYSESDLDNPLRLNSQIFLLIPEDIKEK